MKRSLKHSADDGGRQSANMLDADCMRVFNMNSIDESDQLRRKMS